MNYCVHIPVYKVKTDIGYHAHNLLDGLSDQLPGLLSNAHTQNTECDDLLSFSLKYIVLSKADVSRP